jgi:uncharacterized phage protein gp47/JayE
MTIIYGLTDQGFVPKPQDIVRSEISARVQAKRGASTDVSDASLLGQLIGILSEREASLWDLGQAIYASDDPDAATAAALDAICALTGTIRQKARSSTVTETLTGAPTTVVASGSQIKTASTGALFATASNATIATLATWASGTGYLAGQRVTNASRAYQCITSGTSAGSGGPTTTDLDITDNTAHWRYLGEGTGAVDVLAKSVVGDAIVAVSGDLTAIQTPIGGWQTAVNLLDAVPGAKTQADGSLRLSRESELAQSGNSPADAIRAKILALTSVTACTVYHNDTDVVDGNGQPPHSVQALVQGGDDTEIATVLSQNVAAGIATFGTTTISLDDSQGTPHDWKFTRPVGVNIYVDVTLTYNGSPQSQGGYPSDGDVEVQAAIAAFGNAQSAGKDVVSSSIGASCFPVFAGSVRVVGVQGVLDVTLTKIGTAPAPGSSTTIVITPFQIAVFDTSRVTVHSTAGSF